VKIDNVPIALRLQGRNLILPVKPGEQHYHISWQEPRGMNARFRSSEVDIGSANVNHHISLSVPRDRVVLFVGGPSMGPAVLFWGVIIVFLLLSIGLAQFNKIAPLRYWQWALLSIGLVPISIGSALVVVGWFFITGLRCRLAADAQKWQFNLYQVILIGFTLLTASTLVYAVSRGLLGSPNMQIFGNGSNQYGLNWYQDMNQALLPQAWMLSIPMFVYRLLMLLWALWLAFSVIQWSKWCWECFSTHGYWRSFNWKRQSLPNAPDSPRPAKSVTGKKYIEGTPIKAKADDEVSD
jgi:ABC-type amino acid transport system permease subunit